MDDMLSPFPERGFSKFWDKLLLEAQTLEYRPLTYEQRAVSAMDFTVVRTDRQAATDT